MNDAEIGKRLVEESVLDEFLRAYLKVARRVVEITGSGLSPDFEALIDGKPIGVELTEIRQTRDAYDYYDELARLVDKKARSHRQRGLLTRPIILVCHSDRPPLYDIQDELGGRMFWQDFDKTGFAEIWLMDLSDEYWSAQDPRRPPDLFCVTPAKLRGFHRLGWWDRKPYG